MTQGTDWRTNGVKVVRGASLDSALADKGRVTVSDFAGDSGNQTWIGRVTLAPLGTTGAHHHGATEATVYVVRGRAEIRWGERLEFSANVGVGDFVYFAPNVPHQERNPDDQLVLELLSIRSNPDGTVVKLDVTPVGHPENVY